MTPADEQDAACWWLHRWGKWVELSRGQLSQVDDDGTKRVIGFWVRQERRCARCGRIQIRQETAFQ